MKKFPYLPAPRTKIYLSLTFASVNITASIVEINSRNLLSMPHSFLPLDNDEPSTSGEPFGDLMP